MNSATKPADLPELFISIDVEVDGRVPGVSSMLSFGAAAYTLDKRLLGTFARNLQLLEGARGEAGNMEFWGKHPAAWAACRENPVAPAQAMPDFISWLKRLEPGYQRPLFIGYPAAFDWMWLHWYCVRFTGESAFGHSDVLDGKSFAAARLGGNLRRASKRYMPKEWFDRLPHTHVAEDDAIQQGALIVNMIRAVRGLPRIVGIEWEATAISAPSLAP